MELRADAARNRAAIVEAARAVFAERGLDAPLDDIAKAAGIGAFRTNVKMMTWAAWT